MKTLFNETSITLGRKAQVIGTSKVGVITHVRGTCQDDLVTLQFGDGIEENFVSMDLMYYKPPKSKSNQFRFKFWDVDESYFIFAPTVYDFGRSRIAFGLELFGVRVFYFEYKR